MSRADRFVWRKGDLKRKKKTPKKAGEKQRGKNPPPSVKGVRVNA